MMVIITGVSQGIGKELALLYLSKGVKVLGIGRSHSIEHDNFSFCQLDLSDWNQVEAFIYPNVEADQLTLINNAGILGKVKLLNSTQVDDAHQVLQVNVIAAMQLTRKFLQQFGEARELTIVNMSSGAAEKGIPGWMNYSLSKAALDAFSRTLMAEEAHLNRATKVYCVAPGVVDTAMQKEIRSLAANDFPSVNQFKTLKSSNQLDSPKVTALKLYKLVSLPYESKEKYTLRDIDV